MSVRPAEKLTKGPATPTAADAAKLARSASRKLAVLSEEKRNGALQAAAKRLETNSAKILAANAEDVRAAEELARAGKMPAAMLARLRVTEKNIREMAEKVRGVARLPDPLGRRLAMTELDEGLVLSKESCPLGVVAVVFESRPDVVPQVASLALKSGNAILLKGGAEAECTNEALMTIWRGALAESGEVPDGAAEMLHSRADVMELLNLDRDVDLLIPRGGKAFVEQISRQSRIPVLGHGEGICHVYVHAAADLRKAERIVMDAKVDCPAVDRGWCGSARVRTDLRHCKIRRRKRCNGRRLGNRVRRHDPGSKSSGWIGRRDCAYPRIRKRAYGSHHYGRRGGGGKIPE